MLNEVLKGKRVSFIDIYGPNKENPDNVAYICERAENT